MDLLPAITWTDGLLLAVLLLSVLVGVVRGFVFEAASLLGWVVAWFAAQWLAPELAPHLPVGARGSALNLGASFALVFIAALLVWSLVAWLLRLLVRATPLSLVDRVLGAGFGFLRGAVLLLAVAVVVGLTPWGQSSAWRQSRGAAILGGTLDTLHPLLPPQLSGFLRRA